MSYPPRVPFAEWRPSQNHGYDDGLGGRIPLTPKALFAHSADSAPGSDPPGRLLFPGANPGSVHLWVRDDGHLLQLVELNEPAWGNGVDYARTGYHLANGASSPLAIVRQWYATKRNPNLDSISLEFTGRGVSRKGDAFDRLTEAQLATWSRLGEWFRSEGVITLSAENLVLHSQVIPTACPDGRFTADELLAALAPISSAPSSDYQELLRRIEDLELASYAGGEQPGDRAERLAAAHYRIQGAAARDDRSLGQRIENAGGQPVPGTKFMVEVTE